MGEGSGVGVEEAALKLGDISRSVGWVARAPTLFSITLRPACMCR